MRLLPIVLIVFLLLLSPSQSEQFPDDISQRAVEDVAYGIRMKKGKCKCKCLANKHAVERNCNPRRCEITECTRKNGKPGHQCCRKPRPSKSASASPTPSASLSASPSASVTATPSITPSPSATSSVTPSPSATPPPSMSPNVDIVGADSCSFTNGSQWVLVLLLSNGDRLPVFILSTETQARRFERCVDNGFRLNVFDGVINLYAQGRCNNVPQCPLDADGSCACPNLNRCLDNFNTFSTYSNSCR